MNIPALEANVEEIDRQIARLERELEAKRLERHLTVNDIAAARLQAWYAANPGIELAVGDELAVTDEFRENRRLYNGLEDYIENGVFVAAVYEFDGEYKVSITPLHQQTGCTIDIDTARRMREAWLAQEAGA